MKMLETVVLETHSIVAEPVGYTDGKYVVLIIPVIKNEPGGPKVMSYTVIKSHKATLSVECKTMTIREILSFDNLALRSVVLAEERPANVEMIKSDILEAINSIYYLINESI